MSLELQALSEKYEDGCRKEGALGELSKEGKLDLGKVG